MKESNTGKYIRYFIPGLVVSLLRHTYMHRYGSVLYYRTIFTLLLQAGIIGGHL